MNAQGLEGIRRLPVPEATQNAVLAADLGLGVAIRDLDGDVTPAEEDFAFSIATARYLGAVDRARLEANRSARTAMVSAIRPAHREAS